MHGSTTVRRPTHPGEVFLREYLEPLGITQKEAARRLGISYPRMNEIVNGKRSVTPETALRLGRFTSTDPAYWLELQKTVDLWDAARAHGADDIGSIEPAVVPEAGRPPGTPRPATLRSSDRARRYRVARVHRLGAEPPDDLRADTTAAARLAMVEALTEQSWRLAGSPPGGTGARPTSAPMTEGASDACGGGS